MTTPPATTIPVVDGVRRRRMGTGVACLALFGATLGALGHVAVQARHLEVALALGQAVKEHQALLEQNRRLTSEIGRLKEPGRISTAAREKLGMLPVDPNHIRVIGADGRPAPAPAPPPAPERKGRR